jgi:hypothetical protein
MEIDMNKLTILASAVAASFATSAIASPPPPPEMYGDGPTKLNISGTSLSTAEEAAYALYEGALQVTEAAILAKGCSNLAGTYPISAFADGSSDPSSNKVEVLSPGYSYTLEADVKKPAANRGQGFEVKGEEGGFAGVAFKDFSGKYVYNKNGTILTGYADVSAKGVNGAFDKFSHKVIKDFYRDDSNYYIFDWGLQSVNKLGYPVDKYWQRSQSLRDDGYVGHTVFVKDRLVGSSACRIAIKTCGSNNYDFFWQDGYLVVSTDAPGKSISWPSESYCDGSSPSTPEE